MKRFIIKLIAIVILVQAPITTLSTSVYAKENTCTGSNNQKLIINQKDCEDFLLSLLSPYIDKVVPEQFYFDKVLSLKRLRQGSYYFEIKFQITTFVGAHNPPYKTYIVKVRQDPHGTYVDNIKIYKSH